MKNNSRATLRIGIDTGGTFTDYVIVDEEGKIDAWKVPTTPQDPSKGIIAGLKQVSKIYDFKPKDIEMLIHGTTIGTNAFLEDKCPPLAFITTRGFKDIIEIGRQQRSELYNLKFQQHYPISFTKDVLFEIEERINHKGEIIQPLNIAPIKKLIELLNEKSIENIAISLLFAFLNPIHEKKLKENLIEEGFTVFTSHEISPQIKEYERAVTTIVNAKVSPIVSAYLSRLQSNLIKERINAPLLIMQSNTGMSDVSTIRRSGIQTLYSGLAGGVIAAAESLKHLNTTHLVSLDIGGTSTDVSALIDKPVILRERNFGGFPLVANIADIETIGSGGGSIAKYRAGLLSVGPESQGANPGPACYSLGGEKVTLTDANMYLGYVHPSNFAGDLTIDKTKSVFYLKELLKEITSSPYPLEIENIDQLALSIRKILNHNIAQAIRVVTIQRGLDPRDFALLGFGGAGPMQAWDIAEELEMEKVVIPPYPGTWSAFGLISSNIKHEKTKSYLKTIEQLDISELNAKVDELTKSLSKILLSEGVRKDKHSFNYALDIRYLGQSDFLTISFSFPIDRQELERLVSRFHRLHHQNFAWYDKELIVEIVNISVEGIGKVPKIDITNLKQGKKAPQDSALKNSRKVNFYGEWQDTPIYSKPQLFSGNILKGPCIVDQLDTTIVIPPEIKGKVTKLGYIIMEKTK